MKERMGEALSCEEGASMNKVKAIYPGSFDPMTNGHLDILERSVPFFSEVVLLVASSPRKKTLLPLEQRAELLREVVKTHPSVDVQARVRVDIWSGLIMDYARDHEVFAVIRGLRAASDFEYELMMASMNKQLNPKVETWFMMTSKNLFFVSSSMIKELFYHGADVSPYVPQVIQGFLKKYKKEPFFL